MSKIGRNEPCPCGSGKKYKKCCINKSIHKQHDDLNYLMQKGYSLLEENKTVEACNIWLEVWDKIKKRFTPKMKSIKDAESLFSGDQFLFNWCQDLEMELGNAGLRDKSFYRKRIDYCREFCSYFPESEISILYNMKRGKAESYFGIGEPKKGDMAFERLIEKYPEDIWGYIGWGDMYYMPLDKNNTPNYEKAEQIYNMALDKDIDEKESLMERLDDLRKDRATLKKL